MIVHTLIEFQRKDYVYSIGKNSILSIASPVSLSLSPVHILYQSDGKNSLLPGDIRPQQIVYKRAQGQVHCEPIIIDPSSRLIERVLTFLAPHRCAPQYRLSWR